MNRRSMVSVLAVLVVSTSVWAGPVRKDVIASGAKWAVHLDVEALVASDLGQAILAMAREKDPALDAKVAALVEMVGLDPLKDLKGITLYGTTFDGKAGVAVIQASVNKEKVVGLLAANESHKEIKIGDRVAHQWIDKNRGADDDGVRVGAFVGDDVIVVARSVEGLKGALEVLDGNAASLAKDSALLSDGPAGTILTAGAMELPALVKAEGADQPAEATAEGADQVPNAEFLKKISGGSLMLGSADGKVFGKVALTARSEEDATRIRQMAQGLLAFAQMATAESKEAAVKLAGTLLSDVKVSGEGASAAVTFSVALKDLKAFLLQAAQSKAVKSLPQ